MSETLRMKLNLRSTFTAEDTPDEVIEEVLECEVRQRGQTWFISYTEQSEDKSCDVAITYNGTRMTMARRGDACVTLGFCVGERFSAVYTVGAMGLDITTYTTELSGSLCASGGELLLAYDMNIGGATRGARLHFRFSPL